MLVRQDWGKPIEVYLTRRHSRSRFMPDAFVFPGGAVDAADREIAANRLTGSAGSAAPHIVVAAVRETFEEAGVLLASDADGKPANISGAELEAARKALLGGETFSHMLERFALTIDADRLAYYSNWITPQTEPIRFDAHFFVAVAPLDQTAAADAMEVYDGMWLHPSDALELGKNGEMTIRFPTQKHLERLASFETVADLMAAARARTVTPVAPLEDADGTFAFDERSW